MPVLVAACARNPPPTVQTPPPPPLVAPAPAPAEPPAGRAAPAAEDPAALSTPPPAEAVPGAVESLRAELDQCFSAPSVEHALWAVLIQSLDNGEVLYRLNPTKLVMPASNMKIVTMAVAAERLGWEFTFETKLVSAAAIDRGTLEGDLIAVGSGDPTITARGANSTGTFEKWADDLWDVGIRRIDGRIIGDDNAFDDEGLGAGWAWDYLAAGYAAPSGALQFNEGVVELIVTPGENGGPPRIEARPDVGVIAIDNRARTAGAGEPLDLQLRRLPGSRELQVSGHVPAGVAPLTRAAAVDNPTDYFVTALKAALVARGIVVKGEAIDIDLIAEPLAAVEARALATRRSPPLSEVGSVLMKNSQNVYADTLLKTLGTMAGLGTAEAGREVVRDTLEGWGIPASGWAMYDGSGLSRYNYVSAEMLVRILRQMARDPRHDAAFEATLPIAGTDGTLARRRKGTRAEGTVRAKTGSIANARALSGYLRTLDDERLVFSIIANNFTVPQQAIDNLTDLAVERLANFSRKRN